MSLDRSIAPEIHQIEKIVFPVVERMTLDNAIPVYYLKGGTQEIIKLELVFKAGRSREQHVLDAKTCAALIKEGTKKYTSEALAEAIDYYGITISSSSGMDYSTLSLYCLTKHLETSLQLLKEILENPTFPEAELAKFKKRSAERLIQELSKNDVLAYRKITEEIYGTHHPYGYNSMPESYDKIELDNVKSHFSNYYTSDNCNLYMSGNITPNVLSLTNKYLGQLKSKSASKKLYQNFEPPQPNSYFIKGNDLQNSIKIGRPIFNQHHKDYYGFFLLNTVLGGYFGARLMSNIREEKGYTYNIYSYLDMTEHEGCFYISTDVGSEYQQLTVDAIKEELQILQQELIPQEELQMAKNYIMGTFLSMLDGPLKSSKVVKTVVEHNLGFDHLSQMVDSIRTTTANELLELSQKYLSIDDMIMVSVGDF